MSFSHPFVLFALLIPTALLIWVWANRWSQRTPTTVMPFDGTRRGGGWGWWTLLSLAETLPPLGMAVAVLMLAGPQKFGAPENRRRMTNIQFCVDVSGSMTSPFGEGNRYDAAMKSIDRFLDYRKGDSFGLTFFGHNYIHWCPLTADPSAIRCSLPFMRPEVAPPWFGGTNIGKALQGCKQILVEREEGDKMIILITDGFDYDLESVSAQLAKEFKERKITVFGIVVGYHELQDAIVNISRSTGGDAFLADDPEMLRSVFQKIDQMKQAKIEKTIAEPMDYYTPFTIAGMIVLGLSTFASLGLRYTPW